MSRIPPDDSCDELLTASLQSRPLPTANVSLASEILARARRADQRAAAALRRVRWAQQAATLVAAALLLLIGLLLGAQILSNGVSALGDSTALETSLTARDDGATGGLTGTTTQMAASFGLGLAVAVTLLIGLHSALSAGGWQASSARLRW